jgi:hypothetical protein
LTLAKAHSERFQRFSLRHEFQKVNFMTHILQNVSCASISLPR